MSQGVATLQEEATDDRPNSARALYWRLVILYNYGCIVAIAVVFLLVALGLDLNLRHWTVFAIQIPVALAIYTIPDIFLITTHFRPIGDGLKALDAGDTSDKQLLGDALIQAINLPLLTALRVVFVHGPMAAGVVVLATLGTDFYFQAGFAVWQSLAFAATALFFASPTHAIFEYFAVSREMVPHIKRLQGALGGVIPVEATKRLISVPLKTKLLFLAIFVTAMPLTFFGITMVFKIERLLSSHAVTLDFWEQFSLYSWIAGIVITCMVGAIVMAVLTASEVSRSARDLIHAMQKVESGRLDEARLDVVGADEYADIFRGFQHMVEALRDEQHILAISQDLSGELQLDLLIARIMHAATELLNAERSTLFVHDPKTNTLFSLYAEGGEVREIRIPADQGIAGAVFASGELMNITDAYADDRFDQSVDKRTGFRTRSILCTPIANKAGGQIGVTQVLNKRTGSFTAKDEARLRAFSAQISVCLENAKLFEDVLSMKNYNESILKSTSNGIVTTDVDNVIVTANEAALTLLAMPREVVIGRTGSEVFVGENAWIADSLARTRQSSKVSLAVDAEIALPEGGSASVNLTTAPLIDASDRNIGSMLVLEDITREKRVRSTMARYMSKEVADQLLEAGEDALVGKDQRVTVLFSDVRGFTTIAESAGARETVAMLNEYFTEMVDVIFAHGGILDKYIGDAMMALFGAPFTSPLDAGNAVNAANHMMTALETLNTRRGLAGGLPLDIGLGISTGDVVVGNIGSNKRLEYTVIGDSVNLASRLESANKFYGTKILFSEFTRAELGPLDHVRLIDRVRVKGKDEPVNIYEALGYRAVAGKQRVDDLLGAYERGLAAFHAHDWTAAITAFDAALAVHPGDGPSLVYHKRCQVLIETPPDADWDGVWTLVEK